MHLRRLLVALRPWSFPVTVSAVVVGAAVAYRSAPASFDPSSFLLSLLGGLCVHAFGNLVNTLFDYWKGLDRRDNAADDRALVDGQVTPAEVVAMACACLVGALGAMAALLTKVSALAAASSDPPSVLHSFLLLVFSGVFLAYAYTGWPLYLKYHAYGDVVIVVCFGPLLVQGGYFVQRGSTSAGMALWVALPLGLLTEAILHANNARDIDIDRAAGARTIAGRIGFPASYRAFQAMYLAAFVWLVVLAWKQGSLWFLLPALMAPQVPSLFAAFRSHDPKKDAAPAAAGASGGSGGGGKVADICDRCGQFSFAFGMLLAVAIVLA